jgi:hypothetical protein
LFLTVVVLSPDPDGFIEELARRLVSSTDLSSVFASFASRKAFVTLTSTSTTRSRSRGTFHQPLPGAFGTSRTLAPRSQTPFAQRLLNRAALVQSFMVGSPEQLSTVGVERGEWISANAGGVGEARR